MLYIILACKFLTKKKTSTNYIKSDIDFKDFMKLYKDYTKEPSSFLVSDTTLSSDNSLRIRKNLL